MEAAIQEPVRVNIGCGSRILDGWVNVDLIARDSTKEEMKGKEPDVLSDVREMPFHNEYADEAMAIHVLEHFHIWEAEDLLKEWIRILKPGGQLIIEVPDLEKVVHYMAAGVEHPSLTMFPLYGDPTYKDDLMCHKWGYTYQSLTQLMESVGLRDIERQSAQFHFKDKRDMRVVGYK